MSNNKHIAALVLLSNDDEVQKVLVIMLENILKVNPQLTMLLWEKGAIIVNDFEIVDQFTSSEHRHPKVSYDFDIIYPVLQKMNIGI